MYALIVWCLKCVESKLLQYDNLLARCLRLENALTSERGNTTASIPQCRVFTYLRIWRLRFSSDADIVRLTNARIIIIIIYSKSAEQS